MGTYKARVPSYMFLLVAACALVGLLGFQKYRDQKWSNEAIKAKDAEIQGLQEELQRERDATDEVHGKFKELQKHADMLRSEKVKLNKQLTEMEIMKTSIEQRQKQLQSFLQNREDQINMLKDQERKLIEKNDEIKGLMDLLEKKENEIKNMRIQIAVFDGAKVKAEKDLVEKMENNNSSNNSTGNLGANEHKSRLEAVKENDDEVTNKKTDGEVVGRRAMENAEKAGLEDKVGTEITDDIDGLHDTQLEEMAKLQDGRTRDEDEDGDEKDDVEEDNEGINVNPDDAKESEHLEIDTDESDPEEEQGEENDKATEEEENEM